MTWRCMRTTLRPSACSQPHRGLRVLTALLLVASLAGCGGGGGGGGTLDPGTGGGGGPDPSTSLDEKSTFSDDDLRHFLQRTHWGVKASELAALRAQGLPAYLDAMLELPTPGQASVDQQADLLLRNEDDPVGLPGGFPSTGQLAQWWLYMMQRTTTPWQEVVALFWHDHFAASNAPLDPDRLWWTKAHVNLWRGQGTGNLKSLALAMSRDWVMLQWLDGVLNREGAPNENFAREFWELFLLGVDQGYTQADIVEAARAWTGYRIRYNTTTSQGYVEFDPARHDGGSKTIFGVTIPAQDTGDDFQAMVDITFAQRPVERFIARKVLEAFCCASPPDTLVDALGAVLRSSQWELKPFFRALFLSEAFYSERARAGLVKSPVDFSLGFVRSTGLWIQERAMDPGLDAMGQRITQPPTVNGWPVGEAWLSAQQMVARANGINYVLSQRNYQAGLGASVGSLIPPGSPTSAEAVDALLGHLNLDASSSERAAYSDYLDTVMVGDVPTPDPFDAGDYAHVELRVRGLLYVMSQHPRYAIR